MDDYTPPTIILIALAFLVFIIVAVIVLNIKYKNKTIQIKEDKIKLTNSLIQTKQHLKYKKAVSTQFLLSCTAYILLLLSVTLFVFLPIFQIKAELFGEEIGAKSFSYGEAFDELDNGGLSFLAILIPYFSYLLFGFMSFYRDDLKKTMDTNERTLRAFTESKIIHPNYKQSIVIRLFDYIAPFGFCFFVIWLYNKENLGNNYFEAYNGVNGLIALPIIILVISFALLVASLISKDKVKEEILKEKIIEAK